MAAIRTVFQALNQVGCEQLWTKLKWKIYHHHHHKIQSIFNVRLYIHSLEMYRMILYILFRLDCTKCLYRRAQDMIMTVEKSNANRGGSKKVYWLVYAYHVSFPVIANIPIFGNFMLLLCYCVWRFTKRQLQMSKLL